MNLNPKSRTASFLLTLFFGPLGLFYSSAVGGFVLTLICIFSVSTIIVPIICWILAIAIGDHCTHRHNQSVEKLMVALSGRQPSMTGMDERPDMKGNDSPAKKPGEEWLL